MLKFCTFCRENVVYAPWAEKGQICVASRPRSLSRLGFQNIIHFHFHISFSFAPTTFYILHFHISFSLAPITYYIFTSPPPGSLALTTMPLWVVVMFSRKDPPHLIKDNILGGPQNPDIRYCLISKSFFLALHKMSNRQFWGEPEKWFFLFTNIETYRSTKTSASPAWVWRQLFKWWITTFSYEYTIWLLTTWHNTELTASDIICGVTWYPWPGRALQYGAPPGYPSTPWLKRKSFNWGCYKEKEQLLDSPWVSAAANKSKLVNLMLLTAWIACILESRKN